MSKIMESYISNLVIEDVRRNAMNVNNSLAKIKRVVESFGETYEDCLEYATKGAYWKAHAVIAECEDYINRTGCPSYLREDYLNRAKATIPEERWDYYKLLNSSLSPRFGNTSACPCISFVDDVEVVGNEWVLKQAFIDEKIESGRRYLTEKEKEDYKAFTSLMESAKAMEQRGYNVTELLKSLWNAPPEYIAESIVTYHMPSKDIRIEK